MAAMMVAVLCLCLAPMTEATIFVFALDCTQRKASPRLGTLAPFKQ